MQGQERWNHGVGLCRPISTELRGAFWTVQLLTFLHFDCCYAFSFRCMSVIWILRGTLLSLDRNLWKNHETPGGCSNFHLKSSISPLHCTPRGLRQAWGPDPVFSGAGCRRDLAGCGTYMWHLVHYCVTWIQEHPQMMDSPYLSHQFPGCALRKKPLLRFFSAPTPGLKSIHPLGRSKKRPREVI